MQAVSFNEAACFFVYWKKSITFAAANNNK